MCGVGQQVGSVSGVSMPLGHDSCVSFKVCVLSAADPGALHVCVDDELPDDVAGDPHADVREDLVEILKLSLAPLVLHDPSILTKTSEIEGLVYARQDNEGCLARGRWELFEIWSSISFNL